jgi:hypothetical protein
MRTVGGAAFVAHLCGTETMTRLVRLAGVEPATLGLEDEGRR